MKKILLLAAVATISAACTENPAENRPTDATVPSEKLYAAIDGENSRVQLDGGHTVWTEGDMVSVFNKSRTNECWQFDGKTGDTEGTLSKVSGEAGDPIDKIIAVYPYDPACKYAYYYDPPYTTCIETAIPAVQSHSEDTTHIMVAAGDDEILQFKNVLGWIKISLTGTEEIDNITLKGNNDELLAGNIRINHSTLKSSIGNSSTYTQSRTVTLDCGEGVRLSETPTDFYIAVLPQTFDKGITVTIDDCLGARMTKYTDKTLTVERNHIVPMSEFDTAPLKPAPNEIYYTSSDGQTVEPYASDGFGASIVSNTYENGLGIIEFDGTVTAIGTSAFGGRSKLTTILLPDEIETIDERAFSSCGYLTNIRIPRNLKSIGRFAFSGCSKLHAIAIPDGVTSIEEYTFEKCSRLAYVVFPPTLISIGDFAFHNCTGQTSVYIPENVTSIGKNAFNACNRLTEINIPHGVTVIEQSVFGDCTALTAIDIPNGATTIKDNAFYGCSSLKSVRIPDNVTTIEGYVFKYCTGLTTVNIPEGIQSVQAGTFTGCSSLKSIRIPESVTYIGSQVFYGCSALETANIPEGITTVPSYLFCNCYALKNIAIPDSVTEIKGDAFHGCSSLTTVVIPSGVTGIGTNAFYNCSNLETVYCKPMNPPTLGYRAFTGIAPTAKIYVPAKSADAYKAADFWNAYTETITGYAF